MLAALLTLSALIGATDEPPMPPAWTIISYNIHHAEGNDGVLDLDRIAAIVRSVSPDFVCLQEVDKNLPRTQLRDFPAEFASKLGMHVVFEANYRFDGGEYGNATLSRMPIVTSRNLALPGPEGAEPRGCLGVTVDLGGEQLTLWNTHWGLQAGERKAQGAFLLQQIPPSPAIIVGDFNEDASGSGLKQLQTRFHSAMSLLAEAALQFSTGNRKRLIDHIHGSPGIVFHEVRVLDTPETALASDHFPVVAAFSLK
ncbi:MAG: endonuclease/exonuclease/phosphatase family protein [Candidatus Hydrogenedentes bacterium]|nr:endonuclease/exonuclease/phosphatase family protein [Candidatus Hydrogenedentota bacterium]